VIRLVWKILDRSLFGPKDARFFSGQMFNAARLGVYKKEAMETHTETENKKFGAGGTPGGIGMFLLGFALACAGAWLLTNQVVVSGDYFTSGFILPVVNSRMNSFGLSLVPFIIGIGFLFFDGKSLVGWLLTIAGLLIILAGILMSLHIYFRPTSLFNTLLMLVLLFGGLGLIFRSLKSTGQTPDSGSQNPSA
jgi:hypothetical protein